MKECAKETLIILMGIDLMCALYGVVLLVLKLMGVSELARLSYGFSSGLTAAFLGGLLILYLIWVWVDSL